METLVAKKCKYDQIWHYVSLWKSPPLFRSLRLHGHEQGTLEESANSMSKSRGGMDRKEGAEFGCPAQHNTFLLLWELKLNCTVFHCHVSYFWVDNHAWENFTASPISLNSNGPFCNTCVVLHCCCCVGLHRVKLKINRGPGLRRLGGQVNS